MKIFVDEMLSPQVARLIQELLSFSGVHARALTPRPVADRDLFAVARQEGGAIITKDRDLVDLVEAHGPPPAVIWLRCGNTSNDAMDGLLREHRDSILAFLASGEALLEIR